MSTKLTIMDKTGDRTIIHGSSDMHGELWIDGEYSGQFVIHHGDMIIINKSGRVDTWIMGWSPLDVWVGRG